MSRRSVSAPSRAVVRCPLVKTPTGYVGKPVLIATLDMLTIDLCLTPTGDMLVCCHSGPPDWGTGPKGKGRIFKISYTDRPASRASTVVILRPRSASAGRISPVRVA